VFLTVVDGDVAGVEHVISVTGYFCKLCHKFYNNETMARITHCKSETHFNKYSVSSPSQCFSGLFDFGFGQVE